MPLLTTGYPRRERFSISPHNPPVENVALLIIKHPRDKNTDTFRSTRRKSYAASTRPTSTWRPLRTAAALSAALGSAGRVRPGSAAAPEQSRERRGREGARPRGCGARRASRPRPRLPWPLLTRARRWWRSARANTKKALSISRRPCTARNLKW